LKRSWEAIWYSLECLFHLWYTKFEQCWWQGFFTSRARTLEDKELLYYNLERKTGQELGIIRWSKLFINTTLFLPRRDHATASHANTWHQNYFHTAQRQYGR
jgi:hypothetical protein